MYKNKMCEDMMGKRGSIKPYYMQYTKDTEIQKAKHQTHYFAPEQCRMLHEHLRGRSHFTNRRNDWESYRQSWMDERNYAYVFKAFAVTTIVNYFSAQDRWSKRNVPYSYRRDYRGNDNRETLEIVLFKMHMQIEDLQRKLGV